MVFATKHIIIIVTVILVLIAAFYFYRQFFIAAIANCPEWNKEMGKLFAAGNYCVSSQECKAVFVAEGCCGRREYVSTKFYQMRALLGLVAKYNKYCSSADICTGHDCPADTSQQVTCQDYQCRVIEQK